MPIYHLAAILEQYWFHLIVTNHWSSVDLRKGISGLCILLFEFGWESESFEPFNLQRPLLESLLLVILLCHPSATDHYSENFLFPTVNRNDKVEKRWQKPIFWYCAIGLCFVVGIFPHSQRLGHLIFESNSFLCRFFWRRLQKRRNTVQSTDKTTLDIQQRISYESSKPWCIWWMNELWHYGNPELQQLQVWVLVHLREEKEEKM